MTRVSAHNLGVYADCFEIMDKALAHRGLRMTFATKGSATQFRHRCYSARKTLINAGDGTTPYDHMLIVRGEDPCVLIFKFRSAADLPAEITDLEGRPLEAPDSDPELKEAARALRQSLNLE